VESFEPSLTGMDKRRDRRAVDVKRWCYGKMKQRKVFFFAVTPPISPPSACKNRLRLQETSAQHPRQPMLQTRENIMASANTTPTLSAASAAPPEASGLPSQPGTGELFLKRILIEKVRHLSNFEIPLSEHERKHLIITGKNGSGKTSVLNAITEVLDQIARAASIHARQNSIYPAHRINSEECHKGSGIEIVFNARPFTLFDAGEFIFANLSAKRSTDMAIPNSVRKIRMRNAYRPNDNLRHEFIQYLTNLRVDRALAKEEIGADFDAVARIDQWFKNFEKTLGKIYNTENLKLKFDRKNYNFLIHEEGREPYNFNQLSDGFSAIISIVSELIMRMENSETGRGIYDLQGLVLIDEIETHLHVELQKHILPFLIAFFPKVQFIVTTHSPFVLNSIENAVICDLEKKVIAEDFSKYSYDVIIENYFDTDVYSSHLKAELTEYERLSTKPELSDAEKKQLENLEEKYFTRLAAKIQQIKLKQLLAKKTE
jgi:predicted ATP-binding protein involved in virulence